MLALRSGLKQAKEDLDGARKGREKLVAARQAAVEEAQRIESQLATVEAQAAAAQDALQKCRRYFARAQGSLVSNVCIQT